MNKKNATEVQVDIGSTIETAVNQLTQARMNGQNVYIEFNGHKLYSADVTMDSAYLEIVGKTKDQFDKDEAEWLEKSRKEVDGVWVKKQPHGKSGLTV